MSFCDMGGVTHPTHSPDLSARSRARSDLLELPGGLAFTRHERAPLAGEGFEPDHVY